MELKLNDKWRATKAFDKNIDKFKPTGYEWHFSNVTAAGGVRIYHTLTEDCTWLHVNAHAVYQDGCEERLFTLNTRITSQEDFDNIIKQIHNRYIKN